MGCVSTSPAEQLCTEPAEPTEVEHYVNAEIWDSIPAN